MCNNPSTQTPQQGFIAFLWALPQNLQQKLGDFFLASRWWSFRSCHGSIDRWWIGLGSFEELSWPFLDTKTMEVGRAIGGNDIMTWSFGCQKFLCVSTFRLAWPTCGFFVGGRFLETSTSAKKSQEEHGRDEAVFDSWLGSKHCAG